MPRPIPHAIWRVGAVLLAATIILTACGGGNDDAAPAAPAETTAAPTTTTTIPRPEQYEVETREETYVDTTRPTQANGDFAGAPDRIVRVVYHVPKGDGPFPVVVFGHGWIATPEIYAPVLDQIAAEGYLVVAPAYPLSNGAAPGGPSLRDIANQPGDASFAIDSVLAASEDENSWLYGLADPERIAVGGHSWGGFTTMGFFNTCCVDKRVDAAFPIAGGQAKFEGEWDFANVTIPLLLIHGDQDELVGYSNSETIFAAAQGPTYFLTLLAGKHAPFATEPASQGTQISVAVILEFLDGYLRGNDAALAEMTTTGNVEGVSTLVENEAA